MISRKLVSSVLAVLTTVSAVAQAQNATSSSSAQMERSVDIQAVREADATRKAQLLESSKLLQGQYSQIQAQIVKTQASLAKAKEACFQSCTKLEISELVDDIQMLSMTTSGASVVIQGIRYLVGSEGNSKWEERAGVSFTRPHKTWGGRILLGSTITFAATTMLENFLENKDRFAVNKINSFEQELGNYQRQLADVQKNIDVTSRALAQSLTIEQTGTVQEKTQVHYK